MENFPLVSIIIPVYNGSNYVKEAIDSALNQTYKNIEILVVNDGSKDDGATERIALSYGDKIKYFYKENGGVSSALNYGIKMMQGEYFSWLSHDDKYAPNKVESQVNLILPYKDQKVLALSATRQINKNSDFIGKDKTKGRFKDKEVVSWQKALSQMMKRGCYNGCSFLIPKRVFDECGGFDESLRYSQDMFMWSKIFLAGYGLVYSMEKVVYSRVHDGQLTQRGIDIYHRDCESMSEYLIPRLLEKTDGKNRFIYEYAKNNAKYNTPSVWKKCLKVSKKKMSLGERISIRFTGLYGKIRPFIRKVYYKLVKKVKTK